MDYRIEKNGEEVILEAQNGMPPPYSWLPVRGEASFLFPPARWKEEGKIVYGTKGLLTLEEWLQGEKTTDQLQQLLKSLYERKQQLPDYLIDEASILWNLDDIYWNPAQKQVMLLFFPMAERGSFDRIEKMLAERMLHQAVTENWKEEETLLFIFHFNQWVRQPGNHGKASGLPERIIMPEIPEKEIPDSKPYSKKNRKKSFPFLFQR